MRPIGLVLTLLCAACAAGAAGAAGDGGSERVGSAAPTPRDRAAHDPRTVDAVDGGQAARVREEPALVWQGASLTLEPDGRTPPWALILPRGARAFAVRSWIDDPVLSRNTCFQLDEVIVQGDQIWVNRATTDDYGDYCLGCRERVAVGAGYGLHVLPSGADAQLELDAVELRVALRDCTTLTPLSALASGADHLMLEYAAWVPPPADLTLQLPVAIVIATAHGFAADEALLPDALASLSDTWSAAGVEIVYAAQIAIEAPSSPIGYAANDRSRLRDLALAAQRALDAGGVSRAWPVIVLTGCLQRSDVISGERTEPLALTEHIPGGFGPRAEPGAILIAAERCEGLVPGPRYLDAQTLGAVLAHELGHYLGLYHVSEADGRQDTLVDTPPDRRNLMQRLPSAEALGLSSSQVDIARRHPVFVIRGHSVGLPPP
jgi:hypothetical protein